MKRMFSILVLGLLLFSPALLAQPSRVEKRSFYSNALGLTKNYYVYLPAGYDNSTERYPVVYFLKGHESEWFDPTLRGRVGGRALQNVVDDLIASGEIGKMIIVCPSTASEDHTSFVNSCGVNMLRPSLRPMTGIGTGRFEDYLIQDLIPHIDATLRSIPDREQRAIDGFLLGGYAAIMLSLRHPELFISAGSYDGMMMWYDLDDPKISGANPDDRIWNDVYFDPVFDRPRNVPYMLQHSASNLLRAANAQQLDKYKTLRFHISLAPPDSASKIDNLNNNMQLLRILAELGIRNSFDNPIVAPNAARDYGSADQHAAISLVRHWCAFAHHQFNTPLTIDFGRVEVGQRDTVDAVSFNYDSRPFTVFSAAAHHPDYKVVTRLPFTLPARYDTLDMKVVFSPSSPGVLNDTLTITGNDGMLLHPHVVLRGRGLIIDKAQIGVTYTAGGTASQIFTVDRATGATTLIGPTGTTFISGLTVHPTTKELYATVPTSSGTDLYRISSQSGEALLAATIPVTRIRGIAFHPNGTLFGVVDGQLYEINAATGKATPIGLSSGARYSGLSFNPLTNKLYASEITHDKIYTLDPSTGAVALVGSTGLRVGNYAVAFSREGILYGIIRTNHLIRIDAATGAGTVIGQMSFAGMSALAMRTDMDPTSVDEERESPLPATYQLEQNYPNPFGSEATSPALSGRNPTTIIRYSLPQFSKVTLEVFDMLGRSVAVLANESQPAGVYQARFDAHAVASGVYFYRLQAGAFVALRKMVYVSKKASSFRQPTSGR